MRKALLVAGLAVCAWGADLTGTWKGQANRPDGQKEASVNLELKQDGEKITGRVAANDSDSAPIENAKLDGEKLTFEVVGNSSTFKISLDVAGDTMKGSVVRAGASSESPAMSMELKRDR